MNSLARRLFRAVLVVAPALSSAQVTTADEGTFTISREGARIGREEFRIIRQPVAGGTEFVARGVGAYGERRITSKLQTDASGTPIAYQTTITSGSDTAAKIAGRLVHGRLSVQVRTARGDASNEYATEGSVLVDDEIYHQFFFLALGGRLTGASSDVTMLVPRRSAQGPVRVARGASEPVSIGGQSITATRYQLAALGMPERSVWIDATGHVLKVAVPSQGLVALRDDPPSR